MPRPPHYRPPIPVRIKLAVLLRQDGYCHTTATNRCPCGRKLVAEEINFDHVPALGLRPWNEDEQDTEPPANDPNYIAAKFRTGCHDPKTYGTRYNRRGSDQYEIRRLKEIERRAEERARRERGEMPSPQEIATAAAIDRPYATWPDAVIGRRVEDDEPACDTRQDGRARLSRRAQGRMRGPGFRTNRDGPFKKPLRGNAVERVRRSESRERDMEPADGI